ncbi:MAG: sigma-70 family RNA polymerase sigma factor [Planctomycetes bacterium]|nr:sigma-70 family RNA polymerase sigma factor [Planctomycetota bacterium]
MRYTEVHMSARDLSRSEVERDLVRRCIGGDAEAWRFLIRQYGALIAHAARTTLQRVLKMADPNQVEDVTQAIWTSLCEDGCRRLRSFEGQSALSTWLTVLSTRRTLDYIRTEMRKGYLKHVRLETEDADLMSELRDPAEPTERFTQEDLSLLYEAMDRLPANERIILKMYYLDGLSYRTIAAILHVAPNTVSSYLFRAREHLKQRLSSRDSRTPFA